MSQTLFMPGEANAMVKEMCVRVNLSQRAGGYILAMSRLHNELPGGLIDMVQVANVIKYASENKQYLKPQFTMENWQQGSTVREPTNTRTWYKPAN